MENDMKTIAYMGTALLCVLALGCGGMLKSMQRNAEYQKAQGDRIKARMAEQDGYEAISSDDVGPAIAGRKVKFCTDRQDIEMKASVMPGPDDKERQAAAAGWVGSNQAPSDRRFIALRYTMQGGGGGEEVWTSVPATEGDAFRAATSSGQTYCLWLEGAMDRLPVFKTRQVHHFPASQWKDSAWLDSAVVPASSTSDEQGAENCTSARQSPECASRIGNMVADCMARATTQEQQDTCLAPLKDQEAR
jgi:hypothetical protein